MKIEIRVKILISIVLILGTVVFGGMTYLFAKWPIWTGLVMLGVAVYFMLLSIIPSPRNKIVRKIYKCLYWPIKVIIILFSVIKPSVGIMSAFMFAFAISALPAVLCWGVYIICVGLPSPELTIFLLVVFSTTLLSNHTDLIKKVLRKLSPWRAWKENDAQKEFVKIGEYVLQSGNVHFVVSLLYVLFLVLYALQTIMKYEPIVPPTLSDAVLKAFLVYVAYSTMMKRYDEQEISTEGLGKEILEMYHLVK